MLDALGGSPAWVPDVTRWLLHAAAIGQNLFLVLWLTLPWWRAWVGRALMVKALALAAFLNVAIVHQHVDPYPAQQLVVMVLFLGVTVGIWSQVAAIGLEIRSARRGERNVTGTDDLKKPPTLTKG